MYQDSSIKKLEMYNCNVDSGNQQDPRGWKGCFRCKKEHAKIFRVIRIGSRGEQVTDAWWKRREVIDSN